MVLDWFARRLRPPTSVTVARSSSTHECCNDLLGSATAARVRLAPGRADLSGSGRRGQAWSSTRNRDGGYRKGRSSRRIVASADAEARDLPSEPTQQPSQTHGDTPDHRDETWFGSQGSVAPISWVATSTQAPHPVLGAPHPRCRQRAADPCSRYWQSAPHRLGPTHSRNRPPKRPAILQRQRQQRIFVGSCASSVCPTILPFRGGRERERSGDSSDRRNGQLHVGRQFQRGRSVGSARAGSPTSKVNGIARAAPDASTIVRVLSCRP